MMMYMDLTFVDIFENTDDASVDFFANAYANAGCYGMPTSRRYNILHGIKAQRLLGKQPPCRLYRLPDRKRFCRAHEPGHAQYGFHHQ